MLEIAICDDDNSVSGALETQLCSLGKARGIKLNIDDYKDGIELLAAIDAKHHYDIIFMDIQMKYMDGIKTAMKIRENDVAVQFVFITSHESYMREVFKVAPIDFIIKPIEKESVQEAFTTALKYVRKQDELYHFHFKRKGFTVVIGDIVYLQSRLRQVDIFCLDSVYTQHITLAAIEKELSKSVVEFLRIHKSYLVNKRYIVKLAYDKVLLSTNDLLPVSRTYKKAVDEYFRSL